MTTIDSTVSPEELSQLAAQLNKKHHGFLEGRSFSIKADKEEQGVYVTVTLANDDETFVYPIESRLNHVEEEILPRKAILHLIDYADLYFEDFFAEGEGLYIPIDWAPFEYDTIQFEMRGQIKNLKVERMADEWLAKHETGIS